MQPILNRYLTLLIIIISQYTLTAQSRDVLWVHGYGHKDVWDGYEELFNESHKIISKNRRMYSTRGVNTMTQQISSQVYDPSNTIIVGHSMGGVATAALDKTVRGIVTVGAPLKGAKIAQSLAQGKVEQEIRIAYSALKAGPNHEVGLSYIIAKQLGIKWTPSRLSKILEDFIVKELFSHYVENRQNNQSFEDLQPGSRFMKDDSRYNRDVPKIAIWGNEERPVHYRLASTAAYGRDTKLVNLINRIKNIYWANAKANEVSAWQYLIDPVDSFYKNQKSKAWKRGYDYLNNSEIAYQYLIGATRKVTRYRRTYMALPCDQTPDGRVAPQTCWGYRTIPYTAYVLTASDGFIGKDSQIGRGIPNWNADQVEARGVNHLEMGNHPEMERILNEIWNGEYGGDNFRDFFIDAKK